MRKDQKEHVVEELVERLRATDTLIVADYRGLTMPEIDGVRTELLEHGARFSVVKNTLTRRAAEEAGVPELTELLGGPTAIAFVGDGDMVAVAKTLSETARRTRVLEVRGGILQGRAMTAEQVRHLATLPPLETLQGQVLGAIVGPLTAIARLANAPLQNFVGVIDARIEQLGGEAGAETEAPAPDEEPEAEAPTTAVDPDPREEAAPQAEGEALSEETADESSDTEEE